MKEPIIPLKIFQTWYTKDLPPGMQQTVDAVKRGNPEFEHLLFDDDDCIRFLEENFEEGVAAAFRSLVPGAYKADLWRYCVLWVHGGVYLDIKYRCVNGFKFIDYVDKEYFVRDVLLHPYGDNPLKGVWNGLMIAKPGNPRLRRCIDTIVENVRTRNYGQGPYDPTGPVLLGNQFSDEEKAEFEMRRYTGPHCPGGAVDPVGGTEGTERTERTEAIRGDGAAIGRRLVLDEYDGYRQRDAKVRPYYLDLYWNRQIYRP